MATEEGTVIKIDSRGTWVKTTQSSACAGCSARSSCHSRPGGKDMEVKVVNDVGAVEGDRILLGIETGPLLKATFLLYVFPILALMVGAFIGNGLAGRFGGDETTLSVFTGIVCFGASVLWMRGRANRMAARQAYRPRIVRVIK